MFSFYSVILDLIKARTHKYVRRIPVGATKTGATKYRYFYHGQEGHGKGLAHESELVVGASFVFSEAENKYHAHIIKVDGDMITVKHDDGAKKGTEHVYTKEQFQKLVHFEHRKALEQARQKASKQLANFQQMKESGAKVKQETLDKLQAQVNKLAAPKKQEAPKEPIDDDTLKQRIASSIKSKVDRMDTFKGFAENIRYLGQIIDERFGKQLNEAFLKDAIKPSENIRDIASRLIDHDFIAQYEEQKKNSDFNTLYPDMYTTSKHVAKITMTQGFINSLLLDTLKQLNEGISTAQIDANLSKKTADALREKLKSLVKDKTKKEKSMPIKNITEMPAYDVFNILNTIVNKKDKRSNSIVFDSMTKTIFATDGKVLIAIDNPKNITFEGTPHKGKLKPEVLQRYIKSKDTKIEFSRKEDGESEPSVLLDGFEKKILPSFNKQKYNMPVSDNMRAAIMSLPRDENHLLNIAFQVDKESRQCKISYSDNTGAVEKLTDIGSFDIQMNADVDFPDGEQVLVSLPNLRKVLPFAKNINFGETESPLSLSGVDDNTQMFLMPTTRV